MKKHTFNFFIGIMLGGLVGLIIWYWQKSTSAENGALALLDRLAETDKRLRQAIGQVKEEPAAEPYPRYVRLPSAPVTSEVPPFLVTEDQEKEPDADAPAETPDAPKPEDLTRVKGIGPVFAGRLQEAGLITVAQVTAVSVVELAEILQISEGRAEDILQAAKELDD